MLNYVVQEGMVRCFEWPARTHMYGTRASNQFRGPGQDVGINWQEARMEKEAADAARADKKAQGEFKKQQAIAEAKLRQVRPDAPGATPANPNTNQEAVLSTRMILSRRRGNRTMVGSKNGVLVKRTSCRPVFVGDAPAPKKKVPSETVGYSFAADRFIPAHVHAEIQNGGREEARKAEASSRTHRRHSQGLAEEHRRQCGMG